MGTISGTVVKSGTTVDQPLRNARLELRGSPAFQVTRTDANGRFTFSNLPAGRYRVSVTSDGFVELGRILAFQRLVDSTGLHRKLHERH